MILRNDNNSFTAQYENATATPIYNTNKSITIGGIVKSQIDSRRLKIKSTIRIPQSDLASLNLVLENYTLEMFYTPNCKLYDRTTIAEIPVIMTVDPEITNRIYQDDKVFYIAFEFEEVIQE